MNKQATRAGFILSFLLVLLAAGLKILHHEGADWLLPLGLLASYLCLSLALYETFFSDRFKKGEKIGWFVAFIATGWLALLAFPFIVKRSKQ